MWLMCHINMEVKTVSIYIPTAENRIIKGLLISIYFIPDEWYL